MTKEQDPRLVVRFGSAADLGAGGVAAAALLIEDGAGEPLAGAPVARFAVPASIGNLGHPFGCACCLPRGPVAEALGRLFLARARGEAALFDSVLVVTRTPAGAAAVLAALEGDVVTRARFRLAPDQPGAQAAA
jgi:hypothetical protein